MKKAIPMYPYRIGCFLALVSFVGGCAAHAPQPPPSAAAGVARDGRPARELVELGRNAAARGDAVRAEQYLAFAIERGADRRQVIPILLRACLMSSHLRAALNYAEPYLLENPEDDTLRYLVATVHMGLGQVAAARRELGLLLQRNPDSADAHYLLGILDAAMDLPSARAHFDSALRLSRDADQRVEIQSRMAELRLRESELAHAPAARGAEQDRVQP